MQGGDKTIISQPHVASDGGMLPQDLYISLEVIEGPDEGLQITLSKCQTSLGRGATDVKFNDPTVSGTHALLDYINGELYVSDQQSSNGTFVNGEQVTRSKVDNMDEIKFGNTKVLLSMLKDTYGTYTPEEEVDDEPHELLAVDPNAVTQPRKPIPNPKLPKDFRVLLFVVAGPEAGKKTMLTNQSSLIGRGEGVDIQIQDESVSRRHCQILIRNKDFIGIKDLASKNGTVLNGKPVSAVQLKANDLVELGDTKFKIVIM